MNGKLSASSLTAAVVFAVKITTCVLEEVWKWRRILWRACVRYVDDCVDGGDGECGFPRGFWSEFVWRDIRGRGMGRAPVVSR